MPAHREGKVIQGLFVTLLFTVRMTELGHLAIHPDVKNSVRMETSLVSEDTFYMVSILL